MARPYRIEIETVETTGPSGTQRSKFLATSNKSGEPDVWAALKSIQNRIDAMRGEISSIVIEAVDPKADVRNLSELRQVIDGTEAATNTILASAESIESIARELSKDKSAAVQEMGEQLARAVMSIFEACHFQDISGQRITRVIQSLASIDQRMNALVEAWRAGELVDDNVPKGHHATDPLARGPSSAGESNVVSQDDVDALFR